MNTHDIDIELPEHDCLYETTNENGFIDVEPAYKKSTVLRLIEADRKRRGEPVDKGPWKAGVNRSDKRTFIESDDFTHDVRLYVDGDFADQDEKLAYALGIADQLNAALQPAEPDKQHPDDVAVDAFAAAMKAKLKRAREEKGRGGWQDMSATELSAMLREHVEKGDPVDVANLAMMLHQNGQGITPAEPDVLPGEAVFGFAAWLTSLKVPVTFSECHGAAVGADLAAAYNASQGFDQVREDYHKRLKTYPKDEPSQPAEPSRGEPVAYGIKAANTGEIVTVLYGSDVDQVGEYRADLVVPLYTTPQPAEPVKSSLKVSYDAHGDCLYVVCDSNEPADAEEDDMGILYRRAISDGRLVGITLMNFMGPHAKSSDDAQRPAEPVHETARTAGNGAESGMNAGPQGGAHSASSYSGCGCNSDDCRVNGCLTKRQAQSAMAPGGGGMPAEPVKVPSDKDILTVWADTPKADSRSGDAIAFARAILAHYGKGTP